MASRRQVSHTFQHQLGQLLPTIRVTQVRPLALLTLGLLWAGTVSLPVIAASLPGAATAASTERRLRRWLANPKVDARAIWARLLPTLLAGKAGQELVLVFDPTPHTTRATVLVVSLVVGRRVQPLAWRIVPQQDGPWEAGQTAILGELLAEVAAALPPDCPVTLLGDRGITSTGVIDLCTALGWHYVLRVNTGPRQEVRWRSGPGGAEHPVWALVNGPGQRWSGRGQLFKTAGWRDVELTIWWAHGATDPWVLISDRPAGFARVREYRQRVRCEATYQDCKSRGFDVEASKLTDLARLERLLLALHLALWWGMQLGLRVIRRGQRRRYDRPGRRDLSVVRLGRLVLADLERRHRGPPGPFTRRHGIWRYTWYA